MAGALMMWFSGPASASGALPDGRSYEMVSPPEKNGGGVVPDSQRARAATDGSAVGFVSLAAFGDAIGTGIGTDYVSVRGPVDQAPVGNGWTTHAITPFQTGTTYDGIVAVLEPRYVGEFTADLNGGVFFANTPLTDDSSTASVPNLYRRSDLRSPGAGAYSLVTGCPLCDQRGTPLPAPQNPVAMLAMRPALAGMTADAGAVAFESGLRLTADTPAALSRIEVYEWHDGSVDLAGRVPSSSVACDDVNGPACVPSTLSIAGQGAGATSSVYLRVPHVVSDGSDGHVRIFFTHPTASDGVTTDPSSSAGQLYMRVDGTVTAQLNASERTTPDAFAPAQFLDASADGEQVFFRTKQALTADAPVNGLWKLYMYDATKPASAPDNLTLLSADHSLGDGDFSDVEGVIGVGGGGHHVYFIADGQLVAGAPSLGTDPGIYSWHDGDVAYVGPGPLNPNELESGGTNVDLTQWEARVTPDGRHLLFGVRSGAGLLGYDHGACGGPSVGCRELYVYDADSAALACASCNPTGAPATTDATDAIRTENGTTQTSWHVNHAMSDDGSRVFFSTADALVPEDANGTADAYEWTAAGTHDCPRDAGNGLTNGCISLLSTGESTADSYFLDASANGDDVFFTTRQRLVGWDRDEAVDLYDARVGGGFPEPAAGTAPCSGDSCQGSFAAPPPFSPAASSAYAGAGNLAGKLKPKTVRCRRGFVRKRVRGKVKCVKRPKRHAKRHSARRSRASNAGRRS